MQGTNIDPRLLETLNQQQKRVIDATDDKIIVCAGPGSGKTHTLVNRLTKELSLLPPHRGIVACSFTNEASRQIRQKLGLDADLSMSFVGTLDSFVMNHLILPYKNRLLMISKRQTSPASPEITIPPRSETDLSFQITKEGPTAINEEARKKYSKFWLDELEQGSYIVSYYPYVLGKWLLQKNEDAKLFFKARYSSFYVDEAQDLNAFQLEFILFLADQLGIRTMLIGDPFQSIYEFRGSKPGAFMDLQYKGFVRYDITVSVRCHPSILALANGLVGLPSPSFDENRCRIVRGSLFGPVTQCKERFLVLFEKNKDALQFAQIVNREDVIYTCNIDSERLPVDDSVKQIIEETLLFFYNFTNPDPALVYSVEDFETFLDNYLIGAHRYRKKLITIDDDPVAYTTQILSILSIHADSNLQESLRQQLKKREVRQHYLRNNNVNRVMTIHASKGLEADTVFIQFTKEPNRPLEMEFKRKCYVAFTRAKNHLHICFFNECRYGFNSFQWQLEQIIKNNEGQNKM